VLFVAVFGLVIIIACWRAGDLHWATKAIFTLLYLISFGLLFIRGYVALFVIAQCILIAVVGAATFGFDWLTRDVR
jgi:hypothetical protein